MEKWHRILYIEVITLGMMILDPYLAVAVDSGKSGMTSTDSAVRAAAAELDLREMQQFLNTLDSETQKLLPRFAPQEWGLVGPTWDFRKIARGVLDYFLRELVFNLRLLGELLLLAMALAILENLRHAFESDTVSQLSFALCFLVVMGLVLNSLRVTMNLAAETMTQMTNFVYAIIPLMFSLIVAGGGVTTAAIVHPMLISSVGVMAVFVNNIVFPLIVFAGVLGMASFLVEGFQLGKLANLMKNLALGLLGLGMAIFIGIITVRGFAASVADSTAIRTAKYFSNTFLPVVGKPFSDTMEMAAGCSLVLKSGLGVYGLGLIVLITAFPLLKILAVAIVYQLTGAVAQPLGNPRLADALNHAGGIFINIFAAVAVVGLMFFITLAVLVGLANYGMG